MILKQFYLPCLAHRSSIAASLLQGSGFDRVTEIAGGIVGWEAAKLPVQTNHRVVIESSEWPDTYMCSPRVRFKKPL